MTDDHSFRPRPTSLSAALLLSAWIAQPATAAYVEAGRPGDPAVGAPPNTSRTGAWNGCGPTRPMPPASTARA